MKKTLFAVLLLLTCTIYAQEISTPVTENDQIEMLTTEVGPTGVLQFSFDVAKDVTYSVFSQNTQIISEVLSINQGTDMRKVDLSTLKNGAYTMKFYIDEVEVKQVMFTKL